MYEIVGIRVVDFADRDGNQIKGRKIFVTSQDDNVDGLLTDSFFLSAGSFGGISLKVGDIVDIRFNRYGKIASISVG